MQYTFINGIYYYSDDDYKNIWSVGTNAYEQCGREGDSKILQAITFFEENQINIKKVCVSHVGSSTFFITKDNRVYGCGSDQADQLGLKKRNSS